MSERENLFSLREGVVSPSFIATADIHLGLKLYNNPELEEDQKDNFTRLCDLAIEKKVDYLVLAGDVYDDNKQDAQTISFVKNHIRRLSEAGVKVVGIAGDHDKPVGGSSWCAVSNIRPVVTCPNFAGIDYYDYSTGMENVLAELHHQTKAEDILWIFLHCQFPTLFKFAEPKKTIDFSFVNIFEHFPNLQGIIAGDIHAYNEGTIMDVDCNKEAYIGYCGSLSVTDIAETYQPRSVLYCDGKTLNRLEFPITRKFIKVDFTSPAYQDFNPETYIKAYKDIEPKPVFYVTYDGDSDPYMSRIKPLYGLGYVVKSQKQRKADNTETEVLSIRNDIKTDVNVEAALKECCPGNAPVFNLLLDMINSTDPKQDLDNFKKQAGI